jgi:hypothetical protein
MQALGDIRTLFSAEVHNYCLSNIFFFEIPMHIMKLKEKQKISALIARKQRFKVTASDEHKHCQHCKN